MGGGTKDRAYDPPSNWRTCLGARCAERAHSALWATPADVVIVRADIPHSCRWQLSKGREVRQERDRLVGVRVLAEAVTARFGQGDGASTARKCGKWLAISQATRGGSLRSARDLEAACLDLGMRSALAAVVAPGLWAGLADGEVLPVESLLAGLHHRSLSSSTRTLHSLQEEQEEHEEQLDLDSST
eukprot:CAMPEP_0194538212 /NCGR_PEP_ID=MMETSP0253-20130528/77668_1 /TAXON_ID=2966 /ORGANISM="Noctiluca scintillans" /LENGTH=186 /DNA_ID=CAMNT_0039384299 /DNA_START=213 /DNA_END=771 /DNA_ORIENTATION=-